MAGYLSIDTIVTPSGRSDGVPGGAALYAALGARAAGGHVVLHACLGENWPAAWTATLAALGIDVSQLVARPGPTRRARLEHGADGSRASPSHADALWWERTRALAPKPPAAMAEGDVLLLCPMPAEHAARLLDAAGGARMVADSSEAFAAEDREGILALAGRVAVFAPSREETRLLLPALDDDAAALALAALGPTVVQKRGADGATVATPDGVLIRIEAPAAAVVDPTGAGDATVGALASGLARGLAPLDAARQALAIGARTVGGIGPAALGFTPGRLTP